ncbi:chalcone isomerase family protein [Janthinobacterium fluminis]|uniref:Chalcone isomerase family protein n=1 Tax=Janthinobacterium fluminis TaxID=2987524 RepID=A0ABT5K042_9BURK|nr:chalcone isomerase family protein [Janthinobacterium fluminis]MDC8757825.1 chalcone isomerase family protein [Janthinobacterium fluminis]
MTKQHINGARRLLAAACLAAVLSPGALAVEVGGVKLDDTALVAGKELKLNGAGVRYKAIFKVYAAGLYLPEKRSNVAEILALSGPRRVAMVMLRDVSSEDFGLAFMTGLNNNSDKADKAKILNQTMQFGQMFALLPGLKKGDMLALDWLPGVGTQCQLNGKKIGEVMPDQAFYNAVLKIWIGDKPVDNSLKPKLLGESG